MSPPAPPTPAGWRAGGAHTPGRPPRRSAASGAAPRLQIVNSQNFAASRRNHLILRDPPPPTQVLTPEGHTILIIDLLWKILKMEISESNIFSHHSISYDVWDTYRPPDQLSIVSEKIKYTKVPPEPQKWSETIGIRAETIDFS